MRISKHEMYMELARVAAKRSHDTETQVGAVLVNNSNNAVISMGYNGFIRGANDNKLPNTRPEKYKYMVHAEENLIANSAKNGISMDNCTVYCTLTPCARCMRLLWQCGITSVVAENAYRDIEEVKGLEDITISIKTSEDHPFMVLEYSI